MFRLRDDARTFFSQIEKSLSRQAPAFDMYYFCLIAGLATQRRVPSLSDYSAGDLVDNYPGEFAGKAELIISLLLSVEMQRQRVNTQDKALVEREVGTLLSHRSHSYLSSAGIQAANSYSFAGCDVLRQEWFGDKPASLDYFLIEFKRNVDDALSSSGGS